MKILQKFNLIKIFFFIFFFLRFNILYLKRVISVVKVKIEFYRMTSCSIFELSITFGIIPVRLKPEMKRKHREH